MASAAETAPRISRNGGAECCRWVQNPRQPKRDGLQRLLWPEVHHAQCDRVHYVTCPAFFPARVG
eukprot:9153181-Prorocentrum_lima.AAC.1